MMLVKALSISIWLLLSTESTVIPKLKTTITMISSISTSHHSSSGAIKKHSPRDGMKSKHRPVSSTESSSSYDDRPTKFPQMSSNVEKFEFMNGLSLGASMFENLRELSVNSFRESFDGNMESAESTFIIGIEDSSDTDPFAFTISERLTELGELVGNAGMIVVGSESQKIPNTNNDFLLGQGKVKEIAYKLFDLKCTSVVFDRELTVLQLKNLEEVFNREVSRLSPAGCSSSCPPIKVLDRTALLLDILSQNAVTIEGKMQVELAQLSYRLPRITKQWVDVCKYSLSSGRMVGVRGCSSSGGGGGGSGDNNNNQMPELDRGVIKKRISIINERLMEIRGRRALQRLRRKDRGIPTVAIVGYTRSGKSSLFNKLTAVCTSSSTSSKTSMALSGANTKNVFDTTDCVIRRVQFVADGVRSEEEISNGCHCNNLGYYDDDNGNEDGDISSSYRLCRSDFFVTDTMSIIDKLPPSMGLANKPVVTVWNMAGERGVGLTVTGSGGFSRDMEVEIQRLAASSRSQTVAVNCETGYGISALFRSIHETLGDLSVEIDHILPYSQSSQSLISQLLDMGSLCQVRYLDIGVAVNGRLPQFAAVMLAALANQCVRSSTMAAMV
eukprot:gene6826-13828_t